MDESANPNVVPAARSAPIPLSVNVTDLDVDGVVVPVQARRFVATDTVPERAETAATENCA